jgi:Fic family protein
MRNYDYQKRCEKLLTPRIVQMLNVIHESKGKQDLYIEAHSDALSSLMGIALVQSTNASNRIEGIFTSDQRLRDLVTKKTEPRNRNESEIAGYRDVLTLIHESYDYIPVSTNIVIQLHRDLYRYTGSELGGKFKSVDNVIEERDGFGNSFVRFTPVNAFETPQAVDEMIKAYSETKKEEFINHLILTSLFVLDFLCIHPFSDGNGRMSRLLFLLLLYKAGYIGGKYISMEKLIEETKETYYESLYESSQGWHEGLNNDHPFVEYSLGVIIAMYRELDSRVELITNSGITKQMRIQLIMKDQFGEITKRELMNMNPDISETTIEDALADLVKKGIIKKIGGGRYTSYVYNRSVE